MPPNNRVSAGNVQSLFKKKYKHEMHCTYLKVI